MSFRDHFSRSAGEYARYRPRYPDELYAHLAGLVPGTRMAWDCATGSGQAAVALTHHFDRVLATDASSEQLERAEPHDRVHYALACAEHVPVSDNCVDLATVAAAAHWFDLDRFYAEIRRAVRSGGVLAMWSYYLFESEPAIDAVMDRLAHEIVGPYWPERMHHNQDGYANLPFAFDPIEMPPFQTEAYWSLGQTLGFATTWSATQHYREARGGDPIEIVMDELLRAWGKPERRVHVRWPLHMLVGRVTPES